MPDSDRLDDPTHVIVTDGTPEAERSVARTRAKTAAGRMGDPVEYCPMGCGRITEDPYGGPCRECWGKVWA